MTHYSVYWPTYAVDRARGTLPQEQWFTDSALLRFRFAGDHIWLCTNGESLGEETPGRLFLVGDFTVTSAQDNPGTHPRYHKGLFRFVLTAAEGHIRLLAPPRDASELLLGAPRSHIRRNAGLGMACPRRLSATTVRRLAALVEGAR